MKKIAVEALMEGQTLARPIKSENGKILLAEGATIGSSSKAVLRKWGIPLVYIEETEEKNQMEEEHAQQELQNKRDKLEKIFEDAKDNPLMKMIYDAAVKKLENKNG